MIIKEVIALPIDEPQQEIIQHMLIAQEQMQEILKVSLIIEPDIVVIQIQEKQFQLIEPVREMFEGVLEDSNNLSAKEAGIM